ncbi:MAG: Zn-ribbon domain-containing OB-fold protein [Candidatus Riflebacteria bacterium]|nr:Zn-ribbon domain-containing OB-fold protein [Candidatus Riflebacteria bacterium]
MSIPRHWREIPRRYRLEAGKCKKCKVINFPSRLVCPECGGKTFETVKLSGKGKLDTFTIIRVAPEGFGDEVPYAVGIIDLKDGVRLMAQITDCDPTTLKTGDKLVAKFRKVQEDGKNGIIKYGYKFVPDVGV